MKIPFLAIPLLCLALLQSGCISPSTAAKGQAAITDLSGAASTFSAVETKDAPAINAAAIALTGTTSSKLTDGLAYAQTLARDAQTIAPLLSEALALFTTSTAQGHVWNARGIAFLHRYHIDPRDRMALAKLMRHYSRTV